MDISKYASHICFSFKLHSRGNMSKRPVKLFKLTIDREKWDRGYDSSLYNNDGQMCALGFLGNAIKIPKELLIQCTTPATTIKLDRKYGKRWAHFKMAQCLGGKPCTTILAREIMTCNDDDDVNESERESKLSEMFLRAGIEVTFVDGKQE